MSINIGVIPAAGDGLRTMYLGKYLPKCMLPVYDRPVIHYIISSMLNADVTDIRIVVRNNYKIITNYIESVFANEIKNGINFTRVYQDSLNGDGGAVLAATRGINEPFYVVLGDDLSYPNPLVSMGTIMFRKKALVVEGVIAEPSWEKLTNACSVDIMDEHILDIVEKPKNKPDISWIRGCGVYAFHPDVFNTLPEQDHYWISDIIKANVGSRRVYNCILEKNININTPDDLVEASLFFKERNKNESTYTTR